MCSMMIMSMNIIIHTHKQGRREGGREGGREGEGGCVYVCARERECAYICELNCIQHH